MLPDFMAKVKILPWVINKMMSEGQTEGTYQQKIRYAHWNIGHFSYYDKTLGGSDTTISAANSAAMAARYKKMINDVSPDIFGIAEYNPTFDLAGNLAKDVLFKWFKYQFIGSKYAYNCNSIFSNIKGSAISEVIYTSHSQTRYYKLAKVYLNGVEVYVVETHLDWNQGANLYNDNQVAQLINTFSSYDHVIISADFNVHTIADYNAFVEAGFTIASGSYIDAPTYLRYLEDSDPDNDGSLYLDNIIVKGFAVSNIKAWDESGWSTGGLSDHSIISCDLLLLP